MTDRKTLVSRANRQGISLVTTSKTLSNSSSALSKSSSDLSSGLGMEKINKSDIHDNSKIEIPIEDPDKPSTDLRPHPRGIIRWFKLLPHRIRNYYRILFPLPTFEELEKLHFKKVEKSRNKLARKEFKIYGRVISDRLAKLWGFRIVIGNNTEGNPRRVLKIRWSMLSRDELFTKLIMRMDTAPGHLPPYVRLSDLGLKDFYSDEILPCLGHHLEFKSNEAGVFATVFREGLEGIPENVTAAEIWSKIPDNKPPLTIPVGYGDNSMRKDLDLDDCPHLIVAGATGQGKSNFINNAICFWLRRGLTPFDLQLVLFDLKRGMEFSYYSGLPHLYHDDKDRVEFEKQKARDSAEDNDHYAPAYIESGIVEELSDVMPALRRLRKIMDYRLGIIKDAKHKDFNSFNQSKRSKQKRLPALVIIWDEWARARLSLGPEPEIMMAEITNLARAAGMYFVLGTQNPNTSVISALIGVNFSSRIVFKTSIGGSMSTLGNQAAVGLEVKGRAILQHHGDQWKIQTPEIPAGLIQAVVYKAITGKDKSFTNSVDIETILQDCLDNMDGVIEFNKLFEIYRKKKVTKHWLTGALLEADNQQFDLGGTLYRVRPRGLHEPRRLERVQP